MCCDLIFLSTLACRLQECMDDDELEVLAASLNALGDLLSVALARNALCDKETTR